MWDQAVGVCDIMLSMNDFRIVDEDAVAQVSNLLCYPFGLIHILVAQFKWVIWCVVPIFETESNYEKVDRFINLK